MVQQLRVPGPQRQCLRHLRPGLVGAAVREERPGEGIVAVDVLAGDELGLREPQGTSRVLASGRQVERQRAVVDPGRLAGELADGQHGPPILAFAAVVAGRATQLVDVGTPCHVLRGGDHGDRRVEVVHG